MSIDKLSLEGLDFQATKINIKNNILTELFDYNNKEDDYVKKYEKMIIEIKEKINILNQKSNTNIKYSTPPWSLNIKL